MTDTLPSAAAGVPQSDVPVSPRSTSPALDMPTTQGYPDVGESHVDEILTSTQPTVSTTSSTAVAPPERNNSIAIDPDVGDARTSTQPTDPGTISPSSTAPERNVSIANDPSYPLDVRHNPVTNHRRRALSAIYDTAPPHQSQDTSSSRGSLPASGHRRNVSSISDFANSLRCSTIGSTSTPGTGTPSSEDLATLANFLTNVLSFSSETTAVNSERNSSNASSEGLASSSNGIGANEWAGLRSVVAAAQPGVHLTLNVHIGAPLPSGSGSKPKITLINPTANDQLRDPTTESKLQVHNTWFDSTTTNPDRNAAFQPERDSLDTWHDRFIQSSFVSLIIIIPFLTLCFGIYLLIRALNHFLPNYWSDSQNNIDSDSLVGTSPNLAATDSIFQQPALSCTAHPAQVWLFWANRFVSVTFGVLFALTVAWLVFSKSIDNRRKENWDRRMREYRRSSTQLIFRNIETQRKRERGWEEEGAGAEEMEKGKGKANLEEEHESSRAGKRRGGRKRPQTFSNEYGEDRFGS